MNNTYYALAVNKDGNNVIIDNLSDSNVKATNEAEAYCKKKGLKFQSLQPNNTKKREGNTLTKLAKARAKVNGKLGRIK